MKSQQSALTQTVKQVKTISKSSQWYLNWESKWTNTVMYIQFGSASILQIKNKYFTYYLKSDNKVINFKLITE